MSLITRTGNIADILCDCKGNRKFAIISADNKGGMFHLSGNEFKQYQDQVEVNMRIEFATKENDWEIETLKPIKDRPSYNASRHIV